MDDPIIFTFRNVREGGKRQISTKFYFELNMSIIQTRIASIVDIELSDNEREIKTLIDAAHKNNVAVIISSHDFEGLPKEEIISRLRRQPNWAETFLKYGNADEKRYNNLTGCNTYNEGKIQGQADSHHFHGKTRHYQQIGRGLFGSDLTFASVGGISAPGQISSEELRRFMSLLYDNSYTE